MHHLRIIFIDCFFSSPRSVTFSSLNIASNFGLYPGHRGRCVVEPLECFTLHLGVLLLLFFSRELIWQNLNSNSASHLGETAETPSVLLALPCCSEPDCADQELARDQSEIYVQHLGLPLCSSLHLKICSYFSAAQGATNCILWFLTLGKSSFLPISPVPSMGWGLPPSQNSGKSRTCHSLLWMLTPAQLLPAFGQFLVPSKSGFLNILSRIYNSYLQDYSNISYSGIISS